MTTEGRVISLDKEYATVRVARMNACDSCHKSAEGCALCSLSGAKKTMDVRVKNTLDAHLGDRVSLEANSGLVLFYAACVFLFPIALALALYFVALNIFGDSSPFVFLFSILGFVFALAVVFFTLGRGAKKRSDITMSAIIERSDLPLQ